MCHQTVSLIARHLESHGIPTLILGSALDIMTAGKPPRARFLNYPLGFEAGKPFDEVNQYQVVKTALEGFSASQPGIEIMDFEWPEGWQMIRDRENDTAGQDFRSPRDETPRYQCEEDRLLAEAAQS
ncbi:MAG: hypothetical protein KDI36_15470 [Pseudomonadales bacterium]|nr:hypothetical protein [Pseudomonadales bacterium]